MPRIRRVFEFIATWLVAAGLYLLLACKLEPGELVAACVAGLLAAIACWVVVGAAPPRMRFDPAWLLLAGRIGLHVVTDALTVLRSALKGGWRETRPPGRFVALDFEPGDSSPKERARRAAVVAAVSITPNSYVLGIHRGGKKLLIHQLVRKPPAHQSARWPL